MTKHINYDEAEYAYFRDHNGSGERLDDGGALFLARELDALRARVYEMETPALNALNIFAVQAEAASWQETLTFRLISDYGMAKIITDYSDDIPMVGVWGRSDTVTIFTIADAYSFSMQEIEKAQATGKNLTDRLATAARRGMDAKINDLVWNGDEDYNIVGLLDHPNITHQNANRYDASTGAATPGAWRNGNDAMQDIIAAIQRTMTLTKGLYQPNSVVLPVSVSSKLTQQLPNTNVSYKSFLLQEYPGLQITFAQELETAVGGKPGALVTVKSAEVAAIELSRPFTQHPAQWNNLHAKVPCTARTAGLIVYKPQVMTIIDHIGA